MSLMEMICGCRCALLFAACAARPPRLLYRLLLGFSKSESSSESMSSRNW